MLRFDGGKNEPRGSKNNAFFNTNLHDFPFQWVQLVVSITIGNIPERLRNDKARANVSRSVPGVFHNFRVIDKLIVIHI